MTNALPHDTGAALTQPQVTVIIATYNRSAVLRYAISSVLAQTCRDFELVVVGDACTDDSEAVVRAFGDPRIVWHNLTCHCGNQFGPNNLGLAHARGRYIAYLGHDDLWHRDHLSGLVAAIEAHDADLVFSLSLDIGPPDNPTRQVRGLCPHGAFDWSIWAPPSSWLHRHEVTQRIGGWHDYQSILLPADIEFLARVFEDGMRIVPVAELTTFKLTSVSRTNAYRDPVADEQAAWWDRIQHDGDLRYRELVSVLSALADQHPGVIYRNTLPSRSAPGSVVDSYRARRGLEPAPRRQRAATTPLFADRPTLRHLNAEGDITPASDRKALHGTGDVPADGLFVGLNWHSLEADADGRRWRWMDRNAEIVVTRPNGRTRRLAVELAPGPGFGGRCAHLILRRVDGKAIAGIDIVQAGMVEIDVPLPAADGTIVLLDAEGGGNAIQGDPRILNFRVFGLRWADGDTDGVP